MATIFNTKDILGLRVETRSSDHVGKVASFDFEAETGHLQAMHVKHGGLVAGLMAEHLLVSWDAILEITPEKVVIADAVIKTPAPAVKSIGTIPTTAFMKEQG